MSIQLLTNHSEPLLKRRGSSIPSQAWSRKFLLLAICAALALLPFVVSHFRQIGLRAHYQFFPFAILAAASIALVRFRRYQPAEIGSGVITGVIFAFSIVCLFVAVIIDSSWLGYLSWLTTMAGLIYGATGSDGLRTSVPILALLALMLPPPFELDRELIFGLRRVSTHWSGAILDTLKIPHLMAGNVVELGHRRLMVEEACSGINSLFALLATTLFFTALFGRTLVHTIVLLIAAAFWVVVANVARIVSVVIADRRGIDLTEGWRHEALSIIVFIAALVLVSSTDCLIRVVSGWIVALRARRGEELEPECSLTPPQPIQTRKSNGFCWSWSATTAVAVIFLLVAAANLAINRTTNSATAESICERLDSLTVDVLPETIGDWQRVDFRNERRNAESAFGEFSRTWTYRRGSTTALVSVDYPFPGWHDLTRCYTSQGWIIRNQRLIPATPESRGFVEVEFERAGYQSGYLLFVEFGPTGAELKPRLAGAQLSFHRQQSALARFKQRLGFTVEASPDEPQQQVGQLQLFIASEVPLKTEESTAAQFLFKHALVAAQTKLAAAGTKAGPLVVAD